MIYVVLGTVGLVILLLLAKWFVNANAARAALQIRRIAGGVLIALAIYFAFIKLWYVAIPLGGFALTLLGLRGSSRTLGGSSTKSTGQTSKVRSGFFEMELDHDSGELKGRVVAGNYNGYELAQLSTDQLRELWLECEGDSQSRALLEAYLDRSNPDWRSSFGHHQANSSHAPFGNDSMTHEEAFEILGLEPNASKEEIRAAHKRLIGKLHPDLGGSNFLAAKINQAKDLLLG